MNHIDMKYLEKFNTSLWEEITRVQFCQEIEKGEFVEFDESEKSQLKNTFSSFYGYYFACTDSENALFLNSNFKYKKRLNLLNAALTSKNKIPGLIYLSGGQGSAQRIFRIGKLDDEWYLVEYVGTDGVQKYYKCDQLDGFLELLKSFTFRLKKRDFDLENKKSDREKKMKRIINRLKSMDWQEFNSFYDQFIK